jgi:eukaryotic-like serine/threonine-protein kinase
MAVDSRLGTAPTAGEVVDGFRLESFLHQGGMASIWAVSRVPGLREDDGLPLIMKVPRIGAGEDPEAIVGFEVEQMILPLLRGPHVPRFVARGDFSHRPYLVMERLPGPSLRSHLDRAPLPPEEVADLGARIAAALHDLHRQQVVHLDVKPSNILVRPDGTMVLVDYGLSHHDLLPDLLDEEFRLPMGTGPYLAPEQIHHVRNDPRSDLFALGVMLYHLATGERPFGAPSTVRGLRRRLHAEPVPLRALRPGLPPWLQEVVLRCLEVDPARRYQSGAQLANDLRHPAQVVLTDRAARTQGPGPARRLRRWARAWHDDWRMPATARAADVVARNPIVVVAVDLDAGQHALQEPMRVAVQRTLQAEPGARLACLSVLRASRIGLDPQADEQGRSLHVKQLIALKSWARPLAQTLKLGEERLTFHVLEAPEPAAAIVEFARRSQADHIVMGARGSSAMRRFLGSVSTQVVAEAPCTVTVVRAPGAG